MSKEPYHDLKKWKKIVNINLTIFIIFVIICSIMMITIGVGNMWKDFVFSIFTNLLTGILGSIGTSLFIYFKYLKSIPEENKKEIDKLLNDRLSYETSNHNAVLSTITQQTQERKNDLSKEHSHLSTEHIDIKRLLETSTKSISDNISDSSNKVSEIKEYIKNQEYQKELQYVNLHVSQKEIVDSIEKIYNVGEALKTVNTKNTEIKKENEKLKEKNMDLSKQIKEKEKEYEKQIEKYDEIRLAYNDLAQKYNNIITEINKSKDRSKKHNRGRSIDDDFGRSL